MDKLRDEGEESSDIRQQEVRSRKVLISKLRFETNKYFCSDGTEHFISINAPDANSERSCLLGLLRVRFNNNPSPCEYVGNAAIIREVHIYGDYTPVGEFKKNAHQHKGYGKILLVIAELMAYVRGYQSIVVLSAAGTVKYYAKSNYYRHGRYSKKDLNIFLFAVNIWKLLRFLLISWFYSLTKSG
jgi:histone acetyltransferase (RNA polymerase elongator complex component)